MVSVSLASALASAIVTPENGSSGASAEVVCPPCVPETLGATAGSWLITEAVSSTAGVASALLTSRSAKIVFDVVFGSPALGVKTSARSSSVIDTAEPLSE